MEASRLKPWNLLNFSRISCAYLFYWEEYKLLKLKFEVPDTYFWHIFSFVNNNLTPEMTNIRLSIVRIFWKFMLNCTFKLQLTLRYPGISYPSIQGLPSPRGKKGVFENFAKFTGENLLHSLFFNKTAGLRPATLLKKRTLEQVFSCEICKHFKNAFSIEQLCWLLLWLDLRKAVILPQKEFCNQLQSRKRAIIDVKYKRCKKQVKYVSELQVVTNEFELNSSVKPFISCFH